MDKQNQPNGHHRDIVRSPHHGQAAELCWRASYSLAGLMQRLWENAGRHLPTLRDGLFGGAVGAWQPLLAGVPIFPPAPQEAPAPNTRLHREAETERLLPISPRKAAALARKEEAAQRKVLAARWKQEAAQRKALLQSQFVQRVAAHPIPVMAAVQPEPQPVVESPQNDTTAAAQRKEAAAQRKQEAAQRKQSAAQWKQEAAQRKALAEEQAKARKKAEAAAAREKQRQQEEEARRELARKVEEESRARAEDSRRETILQAATAARQKAQQQAKATAAAQEAERRAQEERERQLAEYEAKMARYKEQLKESEAADRRAQEEYERQMAEYEVRMQEYNRQMREYEAAEALQKTETAPLKGAESAAAASTKAETAPQEQEEEASPKPMAARMCAGFRLLISVPLMLACAFCMFVTAWLALDEAHATLVLYCFYPCFAALFLMGREIKKTWRDLRHPSAGKQSPLASLLRVPRDVVELILYIAMAGGCREMLAAGGHIHLILLFAVTTLLILIQGGLLSWAAWDANTARKVNSLQRTTVMTGSLLLAILYTTDLPSLWS